MLRKSEKRVLVVDDDDDILRAHQRLLSKSYQVDTAVHGREALELVARSAYSAIVSDIAMPEMDGIAFLRAVRDVDLDLPVIFVTGTPEVGTAAAAVQYGAFRYLTKPVPADVLLGAVDRAVRLYDWAGLHRATRVGADGADIGDRAAIDASLTSALKGLWMAYQPIVAFRTKEVFAYEALLRTNEPALPNPQAVIDAAVRLSRHEQLGLRVRRLVASTLDDAPGTTCFVNLHVRDLLDESLYASDAPLSVHARRVVLELTERAALDEVSGLRRRIDRLRDLGFRIAVDDLGAGYSGLTSLAQLEPDVVKVDMSLVRDVHLVPTKRKLVAAIVALCRDLGTTLIMEGIETTDERDVLLELGADLFQGYLFARPAKPFADVTWEPRPAL